VTSVHSRVIALIGLLLAGASASGGRGWELREETAPASAPLRTTLLGQFPSSETCQARAHRLSEIPAPVSEGRLGYTCLPAEPTATALPLSGPGGRRPGLTRGPLSRRVSP